MAKDDLLMIGNIDDIQKLHIKSIYLQEMPRRICHQPETHSFGVLVESYRPDGRPQSYFRIFDDETFERKANDEFQFTETGTSILSMNLPERQVSFGFHSIPNQTFAGWIRQCTFFYCRNGFCFGNRKRTLQRKDACLQLHRQFRTSCINPCCGEGIQRSRLLAQAHSRTYPGDGQQQSFHC